MGQGRAIREPLAALQLGAKARQAAKLAEIREALVAAGCTSAAKQAAVLGVSRATAWVVLNRDTRAGPSAKILKRILSSPNLPPAARRKIEEFIEEKIAGLYGHDKTRTRWFHNQFHTLASADKIPPEVLPTPTTQREGSQASVRYWHKADMAPRLTDFHFRT